MASIRRSRAAIRSARDSTGRGWLKISGSVTERLPRPPELWPLAAFTARFMIGEQLLKSPPLSSRGVDLRLKLRPLPAKPSMLLWCLCSLSCCPWPLYRAWLRELVLWNEKRAGLEVKLLVPGRWRVRAGLRVASSSNKVLWRGPRMGGMPPQSDDS